MNLWGIGAVAAIGGLFFAFIPRAVASNAVATPQTLAKSVVEQISNVAGTTGALSRAQVEAIAQHVCASYFPNIDWRMVVAIASIESSFNPTAARTEYNSNGSVRDVSYGMMQVLTGTASWLYTDLGARAYGAPTPALLSQPEANIYFGTAFLNWLAGYHGGGHTEEWVVRAYNGGQGWQSTAKGPSMTEAYWAKYQSRKASFYGS